MKVDGAVLGRSSRAIELLMQYCANATVVCKLRVVVTGRRGLQRPREVFVDAAGDITLEVRQQNAAAAESHGADGQRRRLDGPSTDLLWRLDVLSTAVCIGDYIHGWLVGVSLTTCTEINVVCPMTRRC